MPSDPWSATSIDGDAVHSYSTLESRLQRAVAAVSKRIRVDPNSRVAGWVRAVDKLSSANKRYVLEQIVSQLQGGQWNHPYRDAFLALTESRTFIEIIEQLTDYLTDRDLRELVSGHPDPSLDKADARGRDKELEWYVAALFRRAGLPVALAEPDVLIEFNGGIRSIAAKRLLSRKQIERHVKKASAQIARAGHPGYIVFDFTRCIDPDMQFVEHWQLKGEAVERRVNFFAQNPVVTKRRNNLVAGVFLRTAYPLISPGFEYGTSERWFGIGITGGDKEEHIRLMHVLLTGLRGV